MLYVMSLVANSDAYCSWSLNSDSCVEKPKHRYLYREVLNTDEDIVMSSYSKNQLRSLHVDKSIKPIEKSTYQPLQYILSRSTRTLITYQEFTIPELSQNSKCKSNKILDFKKRKSRNCAVAICPIVHKACEKPIKKFEEIQLKNRNQD